jgi:hypothetical protein
MQNRMMQMLMRRLISMVMSKLFRKVTGNAMPGRGRRPF